MDIAFYRRDTLLTCYEEEKWQRGQALRLVEGIKRYQEHVNLNVQTEEKMRSEKRNISS